MSNATPIDKIVESALDKVVRNTKANDYWTPAEVLRQINEHRGLATIVKDLETRYGPTIPEGPWGIDKIVRRYINTAISRAHRIRDSVTGMRVYESYAVPGRSERRWMRLSAMTATNLMAAMEQARTQERQLFRKGEAYHILLEELQQAGENATVADVMDKAMPRILEFRAKSA